MARKHYHLLGIGGTAMASLAGLLQAKGYHVTGSDEHVYPPTSELLARLGIPYADGFRPENLEPTPDVVVIGNAITRGNPELEAVLDRKLRFASAPATIREEFLWDRHVLAVAGTHGKTTTTSLLAWLLEAAGLEPSFLVGGVAENFGSSFRLRPGRFFVIEADEYDSAFFDKGPKMWHYVPDTAVVTNVEFDHADIYRDEVAYRFAFARFVHLVPRRGRVIVGWESPAAREIASAALAPVEPFGLGDDAELRWRATDVEVRPDGTRFRVWHGEQEWGVVETPLVGEFNVRNCLAAIAAAVSVGADPERVREGLRTFRSVRRRMEVRGEVGGVLVVDDFAHHPTAVRETLRALRQRYPGRRLVAVFEPRSYTAQRREMQPLYARAFDDADVVVLAKLFRPERYDATTALDPQALVAGWRAEGREAYFVPTADEIAAFLASRVRPGDVVAVLSNGDFGGLHEKLLARLRERFAAARA